MSEKVVGHHMLRQNVGSPAARTWVPGSDLARQHSRPAELNARSVREQADRAFNAVDVPAVLAGVSYRSSTTRPYRTLSTELAKRYHQRITKHRRNAWMAPAAINE